MVLVQLAGRRIVAIALLGDGQGDDADGGVGHRREQRRWIFRSHDDAPQSADDAQRLAFGRPYGERVETVLRRERIRLCRPA